MTRQPQPGLVSRPMYVGTIAFLAALTLVPGSGCHDADYRERRAVRDQCIEGIIESIPELDEDRHAAMDRVLGDAQKLRIRRLGYLEQTVEWTKAEERMRRDRCKRYPLGDEAWIRNIRNGHPEHLGRTWADMVY